MKYVYPATNVTSTNSQIEPLFVGWAVLNNNDVARLQYERNSLARSVLRTSLSLRKSSNIPMAANVYWLTEMSAYKATFCTPIVITSIRAALVYQLDSNRFHLEFQANFFTPAFFAAFCKSSSSVASGMPSLKASSR